MEARTKMKRIKLAGRFLDGTRSRIVDRSSWNVSRIRIYGFVALKGLELSIELGEGSASPSVQECS